MKNASTCKLNIVAQLSLTNQRDLPHHGKILKQNAQILKQSHDAHLGGDMSSFS